MNEDLNTNNKGMLPEFDNKELWTFNVFLIIVGIIVLLS